ncbi:helix-turn-helix transcriptional regulator [Acinetobacter sp.]|jgi:AraC-like DNA-binding protein/mannose-6-phosphate isomerase-like protein (cupin superfamily)|uniref:AraC family transcriptional regulator n=1 Tax=Acinetobacter sp. TaxID=472 RepID=UPI002824E67E|nr:helix-turn-helix transcriptional regulator [Acinetobacter sp.]MDR0237713.1 helix-turn-helix transcriptional regulator [Acinetobacter sp.]
MQDEAVFDALNFSDQRVFVLKIDQQVPDWELASHQHQQSQLLMTEKGLITVETPSGIWVVPAQHALWIPANMLHKVSSYGISIGYVAFITSEHLNFSEQHCTMLHVTSLLKALLERVESFASRQRLDKDLRLIDCLLDEIRLVVQPIFYLPMPEDPRLLHIAKEVLKHPDQSLSLAEWANRCCMSERSLTRTFHHNTGMSINQWRRKLHVVLALQWLTEGDSVHQVAMKLGYDSASSFIVMFKKIMQSSPKNYMRQS